MATATLPTAIEEWTQGQRDSLLAIAERTLAGYGKYRFSHEFIARHVDDFVQDALLQAWVSQRDPETEALRVHNPAGFVSFKVVQLALDKAKGEKLRLERAAPEGVEAGKQGAFQTAAERVSDPIRTDEVHEMVEQLQATKLAMAQLPERQRVAFVKCQLEGRSQDEVAKELSKTTTKPVSRKAVERLVANARVSLSIAFSKVVSGAFCEEQRQLLELVERGWATDEQAQQAHSHLEDCSQCAQVRAFSRFERNAGLAAITLPGLSLSDEAPAATAGLLDGVQHLVTAMGERARELLTRLWPFGGGAEAGGAAAGTVTTTKAVIAICVAAGGTGACTKVLTPAPHDPKPAKSSVHRQQSPEQQVSTTATYPAQLSEAVASSSPESGKQPAGNKQGRKGSDAERRHLIARRPAPGNSSASSSQPAQQEFGFEGSSAPSSGSGGGSSSYSGGPSSATPSAVSRSTPVSSSGAGVQSGGGSTQTSPTVSSGGGSSGGAGGGGSVTPAPSTSSGGGGAGQAQGEFELGP